jgi:hypothetical protein
LLQKVTKKLQKRHNNDTGKILAKKIKASAYIIVSKIFSEQLYFFSNKFPNRLGAINNY